MANRKSMANPLVENVKATSSPLRRRSSIAVKTSVVEFVNDDDAERAALRQESNNASKPSPPTSSSNRRSLNVGPIIGGMSSPQIAEGIAECIKLSTQNKINMKNAFSLNMIDFMSYLVRNRENEIASLQVAGTSLDVSAKIYALRVDVLHQDILKMAGNLDNKDKNNDDNDNEVNADNMNDNASQNNEQIQKKKKKKKTSQKIRTTIEALQGDCDTVSLTPVMFGEADCQTTDALYQAMLPQHCGVGLGLHPYKDIIPDDNSGDITNNINDESCIPWPPVQFDGNREMTMYPNFEFLGWSSDQERDDQESISGNSPSMAHDDLAFDLDASLPAEEDPPAFNGKSFYDMNDDNEDNAEGYHVGMRTAEAIVSVPNFIARLPEKKLDYSFFSDSVNIRWIGPAYWKIKSVTRHLGSSKLMEACGQGAGRKKKEIELDFNIDEDTSIIVPKKSTAKLQPKTVRIAWTEKKLEIPRENHDKALKAIRQYILRPDDIINFTKNASMNATVLSDECHDGYNYGNENDTSNYCPNDDGDDLQADNDISQGCAFNMDTATGGFVGDNLIEAPKLTQKLFIPFSQRAKKLDMRRLKKCMWNCLASTNLDEKDKENVDLGEKEQNNISSIKGEMKFSHVVEELPKKLTNSDAEELSFAIAYVSLLHLANEKCLRITPEINGSDVTVTQDAM